MNALPQPDAPTDAPLDERLALAQALLGQWPGAAVAFDARFHVCWMNERARQWLRVRAGATTGQPWQELVLPWKIDRALLERVRGGAPHQFPFADLVDVGGTVHACSAQLLPLPGIGGASGGGVLLALQEAPSGHGSPETDSRRMRRRDLALASAQVGFWEWDVAAQTASIDADWCALLMIDACAGPDHLARWERNVHPDDLADYRRRTQALRAGEAEHLEAEYRVLTSDFRWVWIMQRGRVVELGADGLPARVSGICIDIDERKRSEVNLRESESRLATALWGARAALWHWHISTDTLSLSPMWFAMTGYTKEQWESISPPLESRVHPDDIDAFRKALRAHLEGETQSLEVEYRVRCANGEWKWVADRGRIVEWDLNGAPTVAIGVTLDIHAQKEAELRLQSSEARLETAVWGARMGLWEMDIPSGRARWFNDWCERTDIDPCTGEDHVGTWDANIHPEDRDEPVRKFSEHIAGKEDFYDAQYRVRTLSGGWKWIWERGRVVDRAPDGQALRIVGVCMDIDTAKATEVESRKAQQRLRVAIESARGGMWEHDAREGRVFAPDVFERILGVDPAVARTQADFWRSREHPEDAPAIRAVLEGVAAGLTDTIEMEYRVRHANGAWVWVLDRGKVTERDTRGRALRSIGFVVDITSNKLAEVALAASEERFRFAAEAARGLIYDADLIGNRIERHGLERLLGYSAGEVAPTREAWIDLIHPEDLQASKERFHAAGPGERIAETEYRLRHRDGHYVHVWDRAIVIRDVNGRSIRNIGCTIDVSDRIGDQEQLRRSELFYRTVASLMPGYVFESRHDAEGRVETISASEGFEHVHRCTLEEFRRQGGWDACLDPESVAPTLRRERLKTGEVISGDVRVRAADGEWKWLYIVAQPVCDPATGKVIGALGSALDITERKRTEEELRTSRSVLQTIAQGSSGWLALIDRNLRCLFVNRGAAGLDASWFVGRHVIEISEKLDSPGTAALMRSAYERVLTTGESLAFDRAVAGPDGRIYHYDFRMRPVRVGAEVTGVVFSAIDVTRQRGADAAVRTQARILDMMAEGVVLVGAAGAIRLTNPACDAMFGYGPNELAGRPVDTLFSLPEPQRLHAEGLAEVASADAAAIPFELDCTRRDGTRFVAECVVTPLEVGAERHWLAVLTDVTERKHMERDILEVASREQQRIGGELHDGLGQKLTSVALMLRSIAAQLRKEDSAVRTDVEDLIGLVNEAIETTRDMARGLSPVSPSRGGLIAALQALIDRTRDRYGVAGELVTRFDAPLGLDEASATHLYRIAQEAITNAVRHGRVRNLRVDLAVDPERLRLVIADDGRGFDPKTADAGMGLKIMRYRAQMLRGELDVRANLGGGTTVSCVCPHRAAGAAPRAAAGMSGELH
jgi:PAS domain S-box-containing protein